MYMCDVNYTKIYNYCMVGVRHAELLNECRLMHKTHRSALIHTTATILHVAHPTME